MSRCKRGSRLPQIVVSVIAGTATIACGEGRTAPRGAVSLARVLAATATTSLNAAGQFEFADPTAEASGPKQIPRTQAVALATAFVSQFGSMIRPKLERDRGDTVNTAGLVACRRALYARSAFVPLDPGFIGSNPELQAIQRAFGSYWLVPFCDPSGSEAALIAVSVFDTDLQVNASGLRMPLSGGGWFLWHGVTRGQGAELPIGPENAAVLAGSLTSRQIVSTPELIAPSPSDGAAWDARWRVDLTDSATVQMDASRESRRVKELYIGYRPLRRIGTIDAPASAQPNGRPFQYRSDWSGATPGSWQPLTIQRDPAVPLAFDVVTTASPQ